MRRRSRRSGVRGSSVRGIKRGKGKRKTLTSKIKSVIASTEETKMKFVEIINTNASTGVGQGVLVNHVLGQTIDNGNKQYERIGKQITIKYVRNLLTLVNTNRSDVAFCRILCVKLKDPEHILDEISINKLFMTISDNNNDGKGPSNGEFNDYMNPVNTALYTPCYDKRFRLGPGQILDLVDTDTVSLKPDPNQVLPPVVPEYSFIDRNVVNRNHKFVQFNLPFDKRLTYVDKEPNDDGNYQNILPMYRMLFLMRWKDNSPTRPINIKWHQWIEYKDM